MSEKFMTDRVPSPNLLGTNRRQTLIAIGALVGMALHLLLRFGLSLDVRWRGIAMHEAPLVLVLILGGVPLVLGLLGQLVRGEFGSDLLAGISIVTAALLGEYLAGSLVVLMLSGGEALEGYAVRSASSVLQALAKRMPSVAHRKHDTELREISLEEVAVGDTLVIFPHEICPVDGTVVEGHGTMDESYLTGEPYLMSKTFGTSVLSGSINGETALTIRADRRAVDSRYARIMEVMRVSEQQRPRLRRLADQLGAWYTPLAVGIALLAWGMSGEAIRFLAVLVVATPCPLLIAIPVAIIGSISLAARRGIIIKDPAVLEKVDTCRTAIFDKTGTLTYGKPTLTEVAVAAEFTRDDALTLVASLERYSKHPLASAILEAAKEEGLVTQQATEISERPGEGLRGTVAGRTIRITSRKKLVEHDPEAAAALPPIAAGLECVAIVDGHYAATLQFRDRPRAGASRFLHHLGKQHQLARLLLVSGDRESEVRYLADLVGIREVHAGQSPEQKLAIVREETARANTLFVGDGINDAPALTAATVGLALGEAAAVTGQAAGAVIMKPALESVDEFLHIGRRMRRIALQSAVGGMAVSLLGMALAAAGHLPPVAGALLQEAIDIAAVVNALRMALPPRTLTDY